MKKLLQGPWPAIALVLPLLVSLFLMNESTQGSVQFGRLYVWLLAVNIAGLVILVLLIAGNLVRLARQVRRQEPGARLRLRLVLTFSALAMVPVTLLYYFSLQSLHRGIDSWFDVRIEQSLADALDLGRSSLDLHMREMLRRQLQLAVDLEETSPDQAALALDRVLASSGASEVTLMAQNARIIASSGTDPTALVPSQPNEETLLLVRQSRPYVGLDPIRDQGLAVRVIVPMNISAGSDMRFLQAIYPIPRRLSELAASVETAFSQYRELIYLRKPLKYSFTLTLSLVLLFTLLAAVWLAFVSARRLTAPIRDLVTGTRAVAAGDYSQRLPQPGNDDLGVLVRSFNEMTRRIALTRDAAQRSQEEVEQQKAYLEVVLGNLSTGVLSFDRYLTLRTANRAAEQILGVPMQEFLGSTLAGIVAGHDHLSPLREAWTERLLAAAEGAWQAEVILFGPSGRQVLMCRGSAITASDPEHAGHVVVFDDITALIQAQRDAAWGEVARRLAHEIKNPLTPIQLSAERLRLKCAGALQGSERLLLERHTETIVQQVEMMKSMVNAFSEYARPPPLGRKSLPLNALVEELLELYREDESGPTSVVADLEPGLPAINADAGRIRQLLHNLLKNATEALAEKGREGTIHVATHRLVEASQPCVELLVSDNGPGLPAAVREQLFEPYITTKPKGTGLGLAIVKKIVEEHGGMIEVREPPGGGVAISVRLPVTGTDGHERPTRDLFETSHPDESTGTTPLARSGE